MPALGTKLRIPLPRRTLVRRARLANPLRPGSGPARLVLIAAPAGFGKTTLLGQWLTALSPGGRTTDPSNDVRVAWLSLDEADADVQQFLEGLVASLAQREDGVGAGARALLAGDRTPSVDDVLVSLIDDLDQLAGPTVIALDDYHRADSPAVRSALAFLLDNLPPRVIVVMTTRADPPLPLARLRTRGELIEIRAADLRFTHQEADQFLREVMGLELDPAQVGALETRTEGWVAGLQLAALSARSRVASGPKQAIEEFVESFSGSHRFVLDYLIEEVLDGQPPETRRFLLLTSVLRYLTGTLCEAVTGQADGRSTLERLDRGNVFVVPLDDHRQWYRYHHLFADALAARLLAEEPELLTRLHGAASRWYCENDMLDDAVHHAIESGDAHWLADLVALALPGLRRHRRDRTILAWLGAVPDAVVAARPVLATARAWSRLSAGDLAGAAGWLDTAERGTRGPGPRPEDGPGIRDRLLRAHRDEERMVPATIAIYRAGLAQARGDVEATVRHARDAQRLAEPADHLAQGAAAGFLGLACWAAGDLRSAVPTFRGAVDHLGAAGNSTDQLGATVVLATMAHALGGPSRARQLYEQALATAERHPSAAAGILGDLHVGLADTLREQGHLAAAAGRLERGCDLPDTASLLENRFRRHTARAGLLVAGGDFDRAGAQLDLAEKLYLPGFFPDLRPIPAMRARVWIGGGRLTAARQWAHQLPADATTQISYLAEYQQLTLARLVVAEHHAGLSDPAALAETVDLLDRILAAASPAGRLESTVEAHLVRALARQAAGNAELAHRDIEIALVDGVPAGFCRLFLDEGAAMRDLLHTHVAQGGEGGRLAAQLLRAADHQPVPQPAAVGAEPLSDREIQVLRLLNTDLTGPEIAAKLFVSINTLRTHTKHIFTKLEVRTRRAAVTRASELNLL